MKSFDQGPTDQNLHSNFCVDNYKMHFTYLR